MFLLNIKRNIFASQMKRKIYSIFLFLISVVFISAQKQYNTSIYEGNKAFEQEDYDQASAKYLDAVKMNEKDFTAIYNLGNALYKSKKYEDAIAQYQKAEAFAKNKHDKIAANYNTGNAYMKMGNRKQAAEYYKKALKQDPYNEKIRKNYEIAKRQDNENNKQQQQQQENNPQEKKENPKNSEEKQPKDQNKNKNPNGQNQSQEGKGEGKAPKQGQNQEDKMPKALQETLLDRIKNKEQETARKILNKNTFSTPQSNEKDW